MGTVVTFDLRSHSPRRATTDIGVTDGFARESVDDAVDAAMAWLWWVDATFSTYRPDSEICRIGRGELPVGDAHPLVQEILVMCGELQAKTDGYFDAWASGSLDPSGLVKGWSLERASAMLIDAGWPDHAIDGGGDIRVHGRPGAGDVPVPGRLGADQDNREGRGWTVGIRHPSRRDAYCAAVTLDEGAVATSGTYERGLHVIDPHRGVPATDLAAVTVVGPELTLTDAYATAALAMGDRAIDWLAALDDHEGLVITASGQARQTPGFDRYRMDLSAATSV
jgi:thiamine biosynthesis lipoprotein